jgi:uncharacterized OB-fold protein
MHYTKPLPATDDYLMQPFWENARAHRLSIQHCDDCGDRHFPPSPVCPHCLSENQSWELVSGRGTLVSWVTFHRAYWSGFIPDLPYQCCLVRLAEGPLLVGNFAGEKPARLEEGLPVRAVFQDMTEDFTLPKFAIE